MTGSDLTGLGAPATKLIEVVSAAVGAVYEPRRIRRKAAADADARQILAKADLEIAETTRHALQRLAVQETRRQENIEEIVHCAVGELPHTVSAEPVDPDWTSRFFSGCQDVSNEQLQTLWARLLAREVTTPGSCSRRTLSILRDMSVEDAGAFEKVCAAAWEEFTTVGAFVPIRVSGSYGAPDVPFPYGMLLHLSTIGLIHFPVESAVTVKRDEPFRYHGRDYIARIRSEPESWEVPAILMTSAGIELYRVVRCEPDKRQLDTALAIFTENHVSMEPVDEANANAPASDA